MASGGRAIVVIIVFFSVRRPSFTAATRVPQRPRVTVCAHVRGWWYSCAHHSKYPFNFASGPAYCFQSIIVGGRCSTGRARRLNPNPTPTEADKIPKINTQRRTIADGSISSQHGHCGLIENNSQRVNEPPRDSRIRHNVYAVARI